MRNSSKASEHTSIAVSEDALKIIATVLGVSGDALFAGAAYRGDVDDTCEMLRIWKCLDSASDRRKLLTFARTLASKKVDRR